MKKWSKIVICLLIIGCLSGCTLPMQSNKFPAWKTSSLLDARVLEDGRTVDGWQGLNVTETAKCKWYNFTVTSIEELNEYAGYKAQDGKKLVHAQIRIENTSDKDVYLFDGDFALLWDLDKNVYGYAYSLDPYTDTMLKNEMVIKVGETIEVDTVYEISSNLSKPYAIYYAEQYSDQVQGNKYFVYIK